MRITVLGSGTSSGVPIPGCSCAVCTSDNPRNNRLRVSLLVQLQERDLNPAGSERVTAQILIDAGTDLRTQALRAKITELDAVLFTHTHADHVCGIDDLRSFNFIMGRAINVWATEPSARELYRMFNYAFFPDPGYQGGAPPRLTMHTLEPLTPFDIAGFSILPVPVFHGNLEIVGFRFGAFAYLTDCSAIPDSSREQLKGLKYLILDGLRVRPHRTHFNHEQAVAELESLRPVHTYLTHLSHEVDHEEGNANLRKLTSLSVELAYDGLVIEI